ncbi:sugar-specific transcriptional regulator TrmB [Nocardioides luteus]|uniref:LuxR family transcriptional regulator n=1 Tax=Nocardioides luteus TaxID=1844 RepID=A0ABQ5SZU6_9ACTN|nr:helix-turn-helix domain-containing protein [Nocardioides luteus]MDR7312866.1 sugar-specific transcriptional regulator TrmB [Nocardioides luteus]GGR48142.1 LuxR family transcriptional regulator [Nocardioides luteus]GLJ69120.1 LuxR family transcriptional regulator [Nocardioides luteus]
MSKRRPTPSGEEENVTEEGRAPTTRALLEAKGIELFELIAEKGLLPSSDERINEGGEFVDALAALVELGLVRQPAEDPTVWTTVDPATVQAQVVTPMTQEGIRLLQESAEWANDFAALRSAWRRSAPTDELGPFAYMHGSAVQRYIDSLVAECEFEALTAQPQDGRDTGAVLSNAIQKDTQLIKRGVKLRTLYQHAARRNSGTREYVAAVTAAGGEVRTLDEFFNRTMIFDRNVAIIPGPEGVATAVAIREPAVVNYLVDVFERAWERGRPFSAADSSTLKDIAGEQRAMTLRMLIEGHSDPAASKRLGVSPRTYAGYVSDLKEEYDADTRFQLGYEIGRAGGGIGEGFSD